MEQSVKSKGVFNKTIVLDLKFGVVPVFCKAQSASIRQKGLGLKSAARISRMASAFGKKCAETTPNPGSLSTESHLEIPASFG
jgi:hypothetical protein